MKKNNHGLYSLIVISVLFIANLFTLFFLSPNTKGNLTSWLLAIIIGVISILALTMLIIKEHKHKETNKAIALFIFLILNVIMIIFSILDIADIKNYTLSTITFVVVPIGSVVSIGLTSYFK